MTAETALEAAAQALADDHEKRTGTKLHRDLFKDTASTAVSAYASTISPDVSGLPTLLDALTALSALSALSLQLAAVEEASAAQAPLTHVRGVDLTEFRKFVDLIEGRAMACDGPVTPFLEQLNAASDAEQKRFIDILAALYRTKDLDNPSPQPSAAAQSLTLAQEENERLRARIEDAMSAMNRCEHDGGFDREIGPIGCDLGDKCVCIGVYPKLALPSIAAECCGSPVHDGDPEGYILECCGKYLSTPSKGKDKT